MDNQWATEHLQTIRTLMERSALYRRALAPIMTFVGLVGIAAAIAGISFNIEMPRQFALYWMAIAVVALTGALWLVRRQASSQREDFWSPPTRRVAQAMFPALLIGLIGGVITTTVTDTNGDDEVSTMMLTLVAVWLLLYGLALHSAGFFMPRGIRWFAWGLLLAGLLTIGATSLTEDLGSKFGPNLAMGVFFGASHLAYGIYLYFTERKNAA